MKNKTNTRKALTGLGVFGLVVILGMSMVFAYPGDPSVKCPDYSEERHGTMEEAFDTLNYDTWVTLMEESGRHPRVLDVVTEENFEVFVEVHEAMEGGDMSLAQELRAQLGLGQGRMDGGKGIGLRDGFEMQKRNKGLGMHTGERGYNENCPY